MDTARGPGWTLYLGDCLDPGRGLSTIADRGVSHVVTDPPYSEHVHAAISKVGSAIPLTFEHLTEGTMQAAAAHFARIAERWAAVFSDIESCHLWRAALATRGMTYLRTALWHKVSYRPQLTGDRPAAGCEAITLCHGPARKKWNGGGRAGIYSAAPVSAAHGEKRQHDTQKPLALMEALILDFTDPGETVCDPFAGSGTTGVACIRNGRRFVGWESDPQYFEIAKERLENTREQLWLTSPRPKEVR